MFFSLYVFTIFAIVCVRSQEEYVAIAPVMN